MPDPILTNATSFSRLRMALLAPAIGVLVFLLLGFAIRDIGRIAGPQLGEFEKKYVEPSLLSELADTDRQLRELGYAMADDREHQQLLRESADRFAKTIDALRELQRDKAAFGEVEQKRLAESIELFLFNQRRDQEIGEAITGLAEQRSMLAEKKRTEEDLLAGKRAAARRKFERAWSEHESQIATGKMVGFIALLAFVALLFFKMDEPLESPAFCAFGAAIFARMVFESWHFPGWQKYVLPAVAFVVASRLLVRVVDAARYPKGDALLKKRSAAYGAAHCPTCDAPFGGAERGARPDNCAACGTRLFEECPKCKAPRHTLLPFCEHCGADKRRG